MTNIITLEDVKKFQFYQMPKAFFTEAKYMAMKNESKLAYMLLWDLLPLSIQNNWINEDGEVFVKLSREKLMVFLNIKGTQKYAEVMKELVDMNLIIYKRVGLTKCNEIYLRPIVTETDDMDNRSEGDAPTKKVDLNPLVTKKYDHNTISNTEIQSTEILESNLCTHESQTHIKTNPIKTNYTKTKVIHSFSLNKNIDDIKTQKNNNRGTEGLITPTINLCAPNKKTITHSDAPISCSHDLDVFYSHLEDQIHISDLSVRYDSGIVEEVVNNIYDMYISDSLCIKGQTMPKSIIHSAISKLKMHHIEHVIEQFYNAAIKQKIHNTKRYLQTMIYNSIFEANSQMQGLVKYQLGY